MIYKNFRINILNIDHYLGGKLYITLKSNGNYYLHRDLTIHKSCGAANFYDTEEECMNYIDRYHNDKIPVDFITQEDVLI